MNEKTFAQMGGFARSAYRNVDDVRALFAYRKPDMVPANLERLRVDVESAIEDLQKLQKLIKEI